MLRFYLIYALILVASLAGAPAVLAERKWVASFNNSPVGKMPRGWKGRKGAEKFYTVAEEGKNRYLKVHTKNSARRIGRKIKVDIVKYPYLNWRWRVNILPPRGDESVKKYCDVPASVNVVVEDNRTLGVPHPKTIKYSWSTTLPKGRVTKSPFAYWPSRCDIKVMRSGGKLKGKWIRERRNVLEDYKRFYKLKEVKSKVIDAIVIMSDSDSTKAESAADYDDIYFSTN